MQFQLNQQSVEQQQADYLVIGIYEGGQLTPTAEYIDSVSHGYLRRILQRGDISGKLKQTLLLPEVPNLSNQALLLIGCGKAEELSDDKYRKIIQHSFHALSKTKAQQISCYLLELNVEQHELHWKIRIAVEAIGDSCYQFNQFKSKVEDTSTLNTVHFPISDSAQLGLYQSAIEQADAISQGVAFAKDLGNTPANVCTPSYLAEQARTLAKRYKKLQCQVLDEHKMKKLGMNALLAVAQGSQQEGQLIVMEYHGHSDKSAKPHILVGKGITFDTGGISIKPAKNMDEMKYDMCGAASVLGTMKAINELELPLNVVGVIASAENMPSGEAVKPGDIVTSMSGQTIEILNTDAEGRLVLCDALTYVEQYQPQSVIDIATLTGAMVVALGHHITGMMSNNQMLANDLLAAGKTSTDHVWQLPMWDIYQDGLDSNFADIANISPGYAAGSITAACFLSRFTKKYPWAHLDIAGTAWKSGKDKAATGRPVPLLSQYLINCCAA